MNLAMSLVQESGKKLKTSKILKCPACGCTEIINVGVDSICSACSWDTTFAYVQSGKMDNLKKAAKDHNFQSKKGSTDYVR
jgi:hypothetical protein